MNEFRFYDTSSLLLMADNFSDDQYYIISSISLNELEGIKSSNTVDEDIKYAARRVLSYIDNSNGNVEVIIYNKDMLSLLDNYDLVINNDTKILACALWYDKEVHPDETIFVSNDVLLKIIANLFFGDDSIESIKEDVSDEYKGFKDVSLTEQEMIDFYSNLNQNTLDCLINEYVIIRNVQNEIQELRCWTGSEYRTISYETFSSQWFGNVKPIKTDVYQKLLADSLLNNKITLVKGPAGSGKTFLSLAYLLYLLDRGKIDKIIVFCNTVATKNSAKLGFYPGTRDEKLLDSQIGNLLSSKLGGRIAVEQMIANEQLVLLPMSDIRGYDTSGMNAGIYISEAQNLDISLMKLALQRIGEDCICIIDGDQKTQVDDISFSGANNGMRRVSKVFRNSDIYGEVELQITHRSKIAQLAELM